MYKKSYDGIVLENMYSMSTTLFNKLYSNSLAITQCRLAKEDSDFCLKHNPGRTNYDCETAKRYCEDLAKDVKRCCPKTCGSSNFTEAKCKENKKQGSCSYPFYTLENECSESMNKIFLILNLLTKFNFHHPFF